MKVYSLPPQIQGLIFDLDSTLYENPAYAQNQVEAQIELLAKRWGRNPSELQLEIYQREEAWTRAHQGRKPSFGNLLHDAYGISIQESVKIREEAICPERWLYSDSKLKAVLQKLQSKYRMVLLTNNPTSIGRRSLRALGVEECFSAVVGLETTLKSKPSPETFQEALRILELPANRVVSVGDRYSVDIEPALKLGMVGILVEGLEDTYSLDWILLEKPSSEPSSP